MRDEMTEFRNSAACKTVMAAMAALVVAACQPQPYGAVDGGVEMGSMQSFKGVWAAGFEFSVLSPCAKGAEICTFMNSPENCWLDGIGSDDSGWQKFLSREQLRSSNAFGSEIYVEFEGRQSSKSGEYGHLGDYPCLIEVETITFAKPLENAVAEEETK